MASLFSLLEVEGPFGKVAAAYRVVSKRKGLASSLVKQGLNDLESTIQLAQALGIKVQYGLLFWCVTNLVIYFSNLRYSLLF